MGLEPTGRETPDVRLAAPGVWAIPVVIPDNPLGFTLVHLLESERGPVLVDSGWNNEKSWDALVDGIATTGHDINDVYGVLVTHAHPDHHGLSGQVRETSGAWIAMHPLDAQFVTEQRNSADTRFASFGSAFLSAGAGELDFADMPDPDTPWPFKKPALADRLLGDGDLVDVPGMAVRAFWTPGHTAGHMCFVLEATQQILTGDHLMPRISPHVGLWQPELPRDPLGEFIESLEKIAALARELGLTEALPAHVGPVADVAGRADELRAHHYERCDEVLSLLSKGPRTGWEIAEALTWKSGWSGLPVLMRRVALAETLAHVRHLERTGRVVLADGEQPHRYGLPADPQAVA